MTCSCKTPRDPHAVTMAKHSAERVGARLDSDTARALVKYCAAHGCSTSTALRAAIGKLGVSDPDAQLSALLKLLKLPPNAEASDVLDAVNSLLGSGDDTNTGEDSGDGATAENADTPPKKLSKDELAYIKREGITQAEFRSRVAGAAKRSQ
jgi:hypothetical protein